MTLKRLWCYIFFFNIVMLGAFQFAELAKTHYWDKEDKDVSVEIELEFVELPFAPVPGEVGEGEEE